MSIEAITAAGSALGPLLEPGIGRTQAVAQPDFARWMSEQVNEVNSQIRTAEESIAKLAVGEGNLHQVMLDLEKARTAFQLTLQVRNKLLEGYQDLMRMQI
jgi:flagellar hook-basal body complex protein FliE